MDASDGPGEASDEAVEPPKKRRKESMGQTIGGVLFGFEQQVLRNQPPPQELVHHARPDAAIPAGDGTLIHIVMPGVALSDEPEPDEPDGGTPDRHAATEPERFLAQDDDPEA